MTTYIVPARYSLIIILFVFGFSVIPLHAHAISAKEIQTKINTRNTQINILQNDITKYKKGLHTLGNKRTTLKSAIQSLALSRKKITTRLSATQNKIGIANLKLKKLSFAISDKQQEIDTLRTTVASTLRAINQNDSIPPVIAIFNTKRLADVWVAIDQFKQLNRELGEKTKELTDAKINLANTHTVVSVTKNRLLSLQDDQMSQRKSIDANKHTQQTLLIKTKNKESLYQKIIAQKKAAEISFERELKLLQSQLNLIVHPGSIPKAEAGILSWPFSASTMQRCSARGKNFGNKYCITQYFGTTRFSTANPQVYNGHGHDGIDMGIPVGTPVRAALSGTVLGTGNTDLAHNAAGQQCYSFGKWVMLSHANGLNTMYAHLSEVDVRKGQNVTTGKIIGYSGMTGYATGPHLHFGVYAAEGTKIMTLGAFRKASGMRCSNATIPVATLKAYLNPLSYLI